MRGYHRGARGALSWGRPPSGPASAFQVVITPGRPSEEVQHSELRRHNGPAQRPVCLQAGGPRYRPENEGTQQQRRRSNERKMLKRLRHGALSERAVPLPRNQEQHGRSADKQPAEDGEGWREGNERRPNNEREADDNPNEQLGVVSCCRRREAHEKA